MFERFTKPAQRVVLLAGDEARALGHDRIGPEHLLLGLLAVDSGMAAGLLDGFALTFQGVRFQIEVLVDPAPSVPEGKLPFTATGKDALERAMYESLALWSLDVGTKHLLLGVLNADPDGVAVGALRRCSADPAALRAATVASSALDRPPRRRGVRPPGGRTGAGATAYDPAVLLKDFDHVVEPAVRDAVQRAFALDPGPSSAGARILVAEDPDARPEQFAAEMVRIVQRAWRLATELGGRDAKAAPAHLLIVLLSPHPWSVADLVPDAVEVRNRLIGGL